ncbi:hypothetical protein BO99DRAFT_299208, partial [Aspergillus violaceofuscus CBS 115571]
RVKSFRTPGSLGCHKTKIYVIPYPQNMRVKCSICRKDLENKFVLMNHAERVHGTV